MNAKNIPDNSVWKYKGAKYRVNCVMERNLSQYNNNWYPTVRYTTEPANGLVFYRATVDWLEKFDRVA